MIVFLVRMVLGVVFSTMLVRLFFPGYGVITILILAVLLILCAYGFEQIHRGTKS